VYVNCHKKNKNCEYEKKASQEDQIAKVKTNYEEQRKNLKVDHHIATFFKCVFVLFINMCAKSQLINKPLKKHKYLQGIFKFRNTI